MALLLTTTNPTTGAVSEYIRIDSVSFASITAGGPITLGYYVNQAAADAGLKPDRTQDVVFGSTQLDSLKSQGLALLYTLLKTVPGFTGATDA